MFLGIFPSLLRGRSSRRDERVAKSQRRSGGNGVDGMEFHTVSRSAPSGIALNLFRGISRVRRRSGPEPQGGAVYKPPTATTLQRSAVWKAPLLEAPLPAPAVCDQLRRGVRQVRFVLRIGLAIGHLDVNPTGWDHAFFQGEPNLAEVF